MFELGRSLPLVGTEVLNDINEYMLKALSKKERQFVNKLNKHVAGFRKEMGNVDKELITTFTQGKTFSLAFQDKARLQEIWQKYSYLIPKKIKRDLNHKKGIGEIHSWDPSTYSKLVPLRPKKSKQKNKQIK